MIQYISQETEAVIPCRIISELRLTFEVAGLNVQGQDFYPQHIYLKPMIFLHHTEIYFNPLNPELNPIYYLLALL